MQCQKESSVHLGVLSFFLSHMCGCIVAGSEEKYLSVCSPIYSIFVPKQNTVKSILL